MLQLMQNITKVLTLTSVQIYLIFHLFISAVEKLLEDPTCQKYPQFVSHLERVYFPRKEEWAICERTHLPTHGANTRSQSGHLVQDWSIICIITDN